jgi:hypothetical protein
MLLGYQPSLHRFKVFGCLAFAYVLPKRPSKGNLSARAVPGLFVGLGSYFGYPKQLHDTYKILPDPADPKSLILSRDVYFVEDR